MYDNKYFDINHKIWMNELFYHRLFSFGGVDRYRGIFNISI